MKWGGLKLVLAQGASSPLRMASGNPTVYICPSSLETQVLESQTRATAIVLDALQEAGQHWIFFAS